MHYEYANVTGQRSACHSAVYGLWTEKPHVIGNVDGRGGRSKCNLN